MSNNSKIGVVYHPDYLKHDTGFHIENKNRLINIITRFKTSPIKEKLIHLEPVPAVVDVITMVHLPTYIEKIKRACQSSKRSIDPDTIICPASYKVALLAVGGILRAIDAVMNGEVKSAFALVRPPGHHAEPNRGMGFCVFNNIAIGAKYAQSVYNVKRILIIDFDVHHGNGTQMVFYDDPTVLFFSVHQYPFYPGTGSQNEQGSGDGDGWTINIPLLAKSGDIEYDKVFREYLIEPAMMFKPELIMVSAGFDAYENDPVGGMKLTRNGYRNITKIIHDIAKSSCEGKIISCLEGGYNLDALPLLIEDYLDELSL